jgi:oxygen-dependent protoporphyrinogen oxidase
MPQYNLGHPERLAAIESRVAAHPGLFLAGAAFKGVGIPDCIASGEEAAEKARDFLSNK